MIKGKTKTGFKFEIQEEIANDYEFIENLSQIDEHPEIYPKILKSTLGEVQYEALKNHVRDETGKVPLDKITEEFGDILSNSKLKN